MSVIQVDFHSLLIQPILPRPAFNEPDISWEDWSVDNFTGIRTLEWFKRTQNAHSDQATWGFLRFIPGHHCTPTPSQNTANMGRVTQPKAGGSYRRLRRTRSPNAPGSDKPNCLPLHISTSARSTHISLFQNPLTRDLETDKTNDL